MRGGWVPPNSPCTEDPYGDIVRQDGVDDAFTIQMGQFSERITGGIPPLEAKGLEDRNKGCGEFLCEDVVLRMSLRLAVKDE